MTKLTAIPAKVVNVDRLGDEYFVAVKVESENYRGNFESLSFGETKPHFGTYHYGWLELVYRQNPSLKAGQSFPLWIL